MQIKEILDILPHRYPFLLVDRVVSLNDNEVVALKNVTINEPFFKGHFPGNPVMPGVLIVEALAQAGALYVNQFYSGKDIKDYNIYFLGLDKVRFRKTVIPGDSLLLKASLIKRRKDIWKIMGEGRVNGNLVCEAELMAMITDRNYDSDATNVYP